MSGSMMFDFVLNNSCTTGSDLSMNGFWGTCFANLLLTLVFNIPILYLIDYIQPHTKRIVVDAIEQNLLFNAGIQLLKMSIQVFLLGACIRFAIQSAFVLKGLALISTIAETKSGDLEEEIQWSQFLLRLWGFAASFVTLGYGSFYVWDTLEEYTLLLVLAMSAVQIYRNVRQSPNEIQSSTDLLQERAQCRRREIEMKNAQVQTVKETKKNVARYFNERIEESMEAVKTWKKLKREKGELEQLVEEQKIKQLQDKNDIEECKKHNEYLDQQVKQLKSNLRTMKKLAKEETKQAQQELAREKNHSKDKSQTLESLRAQSEMISQLEQQLELLRGELEQAKHDLQHQRDERQHDQTETRNNVLLNENSKNVHEMDQLRDRHKKWEEDLSQIISELQQRAITAELRFVQFRKDVELSKMREYSATNGPHSKREIRKMIDSVEAQFNDQLTQLQAGVPLSQLQEINIPELCAHPMPTCSSSSSAETPEVEAREVVYHSLNILPTISWGVIAVLRETAERLMTSLVNKCDML